MNKLSHEQVHQVLSEAPGVIRALVSENASLRDKVASMERKDRAEKVAEAMHSKGLNLEVPIEELTQHLEKQAEQGKLDVIEQAVAMRPEDMGVKIGHASFNPTHDGQQAGGTDFERFIVGSVG